jgi:hypothetical protein
VSGLTVTRDKKTGEMILSGRPAFRSGALAILVNRDAAQGPVEDRRHILHWDEHLKPILASVWSSLNSLKLDDAALARLLKQPLLAMGFEGASRLRAVTSLWGFVATELNSATINLVAGRADINQAIEKVRARVREITRRLGDDAELTARVAQAMRDPCPNDAIMEAYKDMAIAVLLTPSQSGATPSPARTPPRRGRKRHATRPVRAAPDSPVRTQIMEIGFQIVGLLEGCSAPCEFIIRLHEITDSVTFDLSEKARREQTEAALSWLRLMESNHQQPPAQRYADMLKLLALSRPG